VARYLDPHTVRFDVIIFDEASQVRPEDAIGALLRGNKAVIMGDSKQLPPTTFFDKLIEASDEEDEEAQVLTSDMESILHVCQRSFLPKTLNWHYRSKHETLIAVSNQEFYRNRLFVYPSPMKSIESLGLKFIHLPDTTYDRGRSSINRSEAREVSKAVIEHFRKFPNKSLMVGTFNIKQQQAILQEVEYQLNLHPEIEPLMKITRGENFDVKNLETIQGDERDVVFISIGFGFDDQRRLSLNFGPLNQDGGERRLNVLITRARERCVIFSNFRAADLMISDESAIGLKVLKTLLEYAETGKLVAMELPGADVESPFEDTVWQFLIDKGYQVHKQVGCAGFRIDLAIVDSNYPGRYILGIECDGAQYHSSAVARDRDRLRQQILEGLGWQIYRVWSTDWYRDPSRSQQSLIEHIEKAKKSKIHLDSKKEETLSESHIEIKEKNLEKDNNNEISKEDYLETALPSYRICKEVSIKGDFIELSSKEIMSIISEIVDFEGPVHIEVVNQRIRDIFEIKRTGSSIKDKLLNSLNDAVKQKMVFRKGDFLFPREHDESLLRHRTDESTTKIEYVYDSEIIRAIEFILKHQYATAIDDLIPQTARVFGIKSVRDTTYSHIKEIIDKMIRSDVLTVLPNGMIYFNKQHLRF
jgi:very-short-patch-repair endonuclease